MSEEAFHLPNRHVPHHTSTMPAVAIPMTRFIRSQAEVRTSAPPPSPVPAPVKTAIIDLPKKLRAARLKAGMNMAQLGRLIGCSNVKIWFIENDRQSAGKFTEPITRFLEAHNAA